MALAAQRETVTLGDVPVVGVLLALLVLLLVAAPWIGPTWHSPQATVVRELRLQVGADGTYLLDGRPVAREGLAGALRQARDRAPDLRLRIAAVNDNDSRALVGALTVAQRAGVRNIGSEML